jgi:hypothetical protein
MEALKRDMSDDTPFINFDPNTGLFEMSGRSLPEDASKFYDSVHEWVREYVDNASSSTTVKMKLDYFNSASARKIVEILFILEDLLEKDNQVNVIWYYDEEDEVMEARGEEVKSVVELPFELKCVS